LIPGLAERTDDEAAHGDSVDGVDEGKSAKKWMHDSKREKNDHVDVVDGLAEYLHINETEPI
jgi:hypothetical protein